MKSRDYHRHILAVTFTNKATEEMKYRIVQKLFQLSNHEDEAYIRQLADEMNIPESEIISIANDALHNILHNYSQFSIATIDSFFQRVIRAFAREMGLYAGYNVELDQSSVLEKSIDLMLNEIDENHFLKDWLVEWAKKKIEEGRSWNFKADIHRLGHEIFGEKLRDLDAELLAEITDKDRLEYFRKRMQRMIDGYVSVLREKGMQALKILNHYGLAIDDLKYKNRGIGGYLTRLSQGNDAPPGKYAEEAVNSPQGWYSGSSLRREEIEAAYFGGLNDILVEAYTFHTDPGRVREIATARQILGQINVLGVLSDLMRHINEYSRNQNLFLLSEASGFLKTIINQAETPFIYERVGNFYNHFMIDEFQDTSAIQWENFRPLIKNSLASGYPDWIVGDVKQSIYRWRNTNWKILAEGIEADMAPQNVEVIGLNKNWRSAPEIIHFNNRFFREAIHRMVQAFLRDESETAGQDDLNGLVVSMTDAYRDYYQHLPEKDVSEKGYVHLSMIPESPNDEDENWREKVLNQLPAQIEQLQDLGYRLSDIAILVREKKDAQMIADTMLAYRQEHPESAYNYEVLSNESLLVGNSAAVKWLVAAMRFIVDPADKINRAFLQYESCMVRTVLGEDPDIPEHFTGIPEKTLGKWRSLPVYELVNRLIQTCGLYDHLEEAPFIQAFQDILLQYIHREAADVRSFLDWWDEEKEKKYVNMPEEQDAVRLMTIHKSKGLEFDVVIIPFCDWPFTKNGKTILWCTPQDAPFNDIKLLPLKFDGNLKKTIFAKDYLHEKMLSCIDNLNLLYVAFTRARKALFISAPQKESEKFTGVKDLVHQIFHFPNTEISPSGNDFYINFDDYWQSESACFELGILTGKESKDQNPSDKDYFLDSAIRVGRHISHILRNSAYLSPVAPHGIQIDRGKLLHEIFRQAITVDDLERVIQTFIVEGKLSRHEGKSILETACEALCRPLVREWFRPGITVKTEIEILLPDGRIVRPDRIVFDGSEVQVIDYKFGKIESDDYRKQVMRYMQHIRAMGYLHVRGFVWYVSLQKIEEINDTSIEWIQTKIF